MKAVERHIYCCPTNSGQEAEQGVEGHGGLVVPLPQVVLLLNLPEGVVKNWPGHFHVGRDVAFTRGEFSQMV